MTFYTYYHPLFTSPDETIWWWTKNLTWCVQIIINTNKFNRVSFYELKGTPRIAKERIRLYLIQILLSISEGFAIGSCSKNFKPPSITYTHLICSRSNTATHTENYTELLSLRQIIGHRAFDEESLFCYIFSPLNYH